MKAINLPQWQLVALPAVIAALGLFYFAKYYVADELIYANKRIQLLQSDLQVTKDGLANESARAIVAEREVDVVRRANEILRSSERDRQDEISSLQADLAFYRRLGGASGSQAALAVHHLELQETQSPRVFRIIFTLTQNIRWAAVISGRIHLGVDGIQEGTARHLDEDELLPDSAEPMTFRFKYFQQLERLITLPENFEPDRLSIKLRSGSLSTTVEQSLQWGSLFNAISLEETETPENSTN